MGPTWVLSAADGPHVGPMNLAIKDVNLGFQSSISKEYEHDIIRYRHEFNIDPTLSGRSDV